MLREFVFLVEADCLQLGPNYFERVGYGRCHHSRNHPRYHFIESKGLELLVEHIMKTSKCPFFYTTGQSTTKEGFESLSLLYVLYCRKDRTITMKIGQLETCLNYIQRVCQECTN